MPQPPNSDTNDTLEMDLAVALASVRSACALIEDNADADDPTKDALTLGRVYADLLTARSAVAGAVARMRCREEHAATMPAPPVAPAHLRLVK